MTALSSTIGSSSTPVYVNSGTLTACGGGIIMDYGSLGSINVDSDSKVKTSFFGMGGSLKGTLPENCNNYDYIFINLYTTGEIGQIAFINGANLYIRGCDDPTASTLEWTDWRHLLWETASVTKYS